MISTNPLLYGASGRAGNMVVKNYNGKLVISACPDMSDRVLSEKQKEFNEYMRYANHWAKNIVADPKRKEEAMQTLRVPANKVYRALVKEYILKKGNTEQILQSIVADKYKDRNIQSAQYIDSNPEILQGKPVIKGTTITVETVLQRLSKGLTFPEILEEYPAIRMEAILAALAYASETVANSK